MHGVGNVDGLEMFQIDGYPDAAVAAKTVSNDNGTTAIAEGKSVALSDNKMMICVCSLSDINSVGIGQKRPCRFFFNVCNNRFYHFRPYIADIAFLAKMDF